MDELHASHRLVARDGERALPDHLRERAVVVGCLKGRIHFAVSRGSLLLHNLERRPWAAMTIIDRDHDLTLFGEVERLGTARDLPDLVGELHGLSPRGQFTPRDWNGFLYVVHIDRIFLSR